VGECYWGGGVKMRIGASQLGASCEASNMKIRELDPFFCVFFVWDVFF